MKSIGTLLLLIAITYQTSANAIDGIYKGRGHYDLIKIQTQSPGHIFVHTCGNFADGSCMEIRAIAAQTSAPSTYSSLTGTITALYGTQTCLYPIRLELSFNNKKLFISEYGPSAFPLKSRGCPRQQDLNYTYYIEASNYALIQ